MIIGIFIAMAIAAFVGAPLLPVLVIGALSQAGAAFALTRSEASLRMAVGVVIAIGARIMVPLLAAQQTGELPLPVPLHWLDAGLYLAAALCLICCTIIGVLGQHRRKIARQGA